MARPSASRPSGGHTAVANSPEANDFPEVLRAESQPPAQGSDPRVAAVRDGDSEDVPRHRTAEAAHFEARQAPDTSGLADIGEASFGTEGPHVETVHGPDDRVQITNTSAYPWRAHASLLITAADNSMWIGTGWFIGPHTLITAGHVVHIKNSGVPGRDGWVKKIVVMPGRNGSTMPYGSVTSNNFRAVSGWTASGNENYDYGAIIIPNELGNTVGTFGFGIYSDADLLASVGNISGYPGDKPTGTQWYASRQIASVNPFKVYYDIDTAGGQSGAAVYRTINGARYSVAIHAYGGATTNSGTRIIKPVYDNMVLWKA